MINDYLSKDVLAGMVVLYNPDNSVINNIASYFVYVDHLYIIDNSDLQDQGLLTAIFSLNKNISYIKLEENLGIAKALNEGCNLAFINGYKWILTMDQDSYFATSGFFDAVFNKHFFDIVILAASYNEIYINARPSKYTSISEVDFVITSGNILNLTAWKLLNGFTEKLFIDEVDNDFCIRAKNKGLKILATDNIYLSHELGHDLLVKHFLTGKTIAVSLHPPLRVYYVIRNNIYIWKKFMFTNFGFVTNRIKNILFLILKVVLYFPDKKKYFKFIGKGIKDSFLGNYGKIIN